jgi:hypothetical protein
MNSPAPYTRETLDRIRKGASAESLGWPPERFRNVCKVHCIDPLRVVVPIEPVHERPGRPRAPSTGGFKEHSRNALAGQPSEYREVRARTIGKEIITKQNQVIRLTATSVRKSDELSSTYGLSRTGMLTMICEAAIRQGLVPMLLGLDTEADAKS